MDWTAIIIAVVGTGAVVKLADYFLMGGKKKANLEVMQTELERVDSRVEKLERMVQWYEMRDNILTSATNCAHKCETPDEDCPVQQYLRNNPLPLKAPWTAS